MKKLFKGALCACLVFAAVSAPAATAAANSAPSYWHGSTSAGLIIQTENCPVQVEKETLTLDINEFPENYYSDHNEDRFLSYSSKVTAKYELYNPEDYEVEVKLAFPFGATPEYAYDLYNAETAVDDTAKYTVKADGVNVERTLRHTYFDNYYGFDKSDVKKIKDDFATDGFLKPDSAVTKYTVKFNLGQNQPDLFKAVVAVSCDLGDYRMFHNEGNVLNALPDNVIELYISDNYACNFYLVGDQPAQEELSINIKTPDGKPVYNVYKSVEVSQLTFKELILLDKKDGVSDVDWYNAVLDCYAVYNRLNVSKNLMRWYEYTLKIPAGGKLVNEVSAPLYPTIHDGAYFYEYYLSPARGWQKFKELEIIINSPYYLYNCTLGEPIKTENRYKYICYGLPSGELCFSMRETEYLPRHYGGGNVAGWIIFGVFAGLAVLPLIATAIGVPLYFKNKRK